MTEISEIAESPGENSKLYHEQILFSNMQVDQISKNKIEAENIREKLRDIPETQQPDKDAHRFPAYKYRHYGLYDGDFSKCIEPEIPIKNPDCSLGLEIEQTHKEITS